MDMLVYQLVLRIMVGSIRIVQYEHVSQDYLDNWTYNKSSL